MFPESFAEQWIGQLTEPGDTVLDPFCGRGTAPFQALLMGRAAIGTDINPVAYCITRAKLCAPAELTVKKRIRELRFAFEADALESERRKLPLFFKQAYSASTLRQVLFLKRELAWRKSRVDNIIAALTLGALHGESVRSARYLSNQMPRTISTKPAYSIRFWEERGLKPPKRNAFDLLDELTTYRYATVPPKGSAVVFNSDMRELPSLLRSYREPLRCVVTSPPYLDVTSFEEDQWLRLWFLGGEETPSRRGRYSLDDRHTTRRSYWRLIADVWRILGAILDTNANVVIRLGVRGGSANDVVRALTASSAFSGRRVALASSEITELQRRQTDAFRPGSAGCALEVDCHFAMK